MKYSLGKLVLRTLFPAICIIAGVNAAQAQTCTTDDSATLKTCVDTQVAACRTAAPTSCKQYEPVLTIADVAKLAVTNCCAKTSKTARKLCLVKESKKYLPEVASGSQRDFFKKARDIIKRLKNIHCKNDNSYQITASAALF